MKKSEMQKIKVWDGFVRFFHWTMVVLIAVLYYSAENSLMELHFVAGFSLFALLISRLIWGVIGSDTAKLSALIHSPKSMFYSLKGASQLKPGHNAAGSYMIIAFFTLLLTQATAGLMTTDDIMYDGPLVAVVSSDLSEIASSLHRQLFDWILIAIGLHISAILVYRIKGKPLVRAMITGETTESYQHSVKMKNGWWGLVIFVIILTTVMYFWAEDSISVLLS